MAKPIQALRAAYDGNPKAMADALSGRGVKQAANRTDATGRGTLTCAVAGRTGDAQASQCVELLLLAGAQVNLVDQHCQSALHFAARFGRPLCAIALIDAGADVDIATDFGMRPIHLALQAANPQLVSELIRAGADILSPSADGVAPLDFAKEVHSKQASAEVKLRMAESLGILELHIATGRGHAPKKPHRI